MIKGFEKLGYEQSVIAGIDVDDSIKELETILKGKILPQVVYNTEELDFNVVGMSDSMPYKSTRYRDMNAEMVGKS